MIITFEDAGQVPGSKYLCSINGGSDLDCSSGTRFAADMFVGGQQNTIEIYAVNNAVAGKPATSKKVGVGVMIYNDSPTNTLAPELISMTHTTLSVRYRISDADSVTSKSCQLVRGTSVVATATPDASGICTFSVNPETTYEVRTTGYANILGPDGKMTTQYVETRITVTTPEVPNSGPNASPDTANTTVGTPVTINVLANDTDPDGDSLTVTGATVVGGGAVGTVSHNTHSLTFTPVASGIATINYTISDGRGGTSSSHATVTVDTVDSTPPALTSSSNLGVSNIGTTVSHTLTFDENIGTVSVGTVPTGMTVTATKSGSSVTLEISTTALFTAFSSVTIPVTVSDTASPANSGVVNITKTINDVPPVAGGAFASLGDMTVGDQ